MKCKHTNLDETNKQGLKPAATSHLKREQGSGMSWNFKSRKAEECFIISWLEISVEYFLVF